MFVGIDVSHRIKPGSKSILAFCSTIDQKFAQYFTKIAFQPKGQEISLELQKDNSNGFKGIS